MLTRSLARRGCIIHNPTITFRKSRNTISRIIDPGKPHPVLSSPFPLLTGIVEWNNSKKPSVKSVKSNVCANNVGMLSHKPTSRNLGFCKLTIRQKSGVDMESWWGQRGVRVVVGDDDDD